MHTDSITDMLNRIRNAQAVNHETVEVPFSKLKFEIAKILEKNKFIERADIKNSRGGGKRKGKANEIIEISLRYYNGNVPAISGLKRISKPGQRVYSSILDIKRVRGGHGLNIISTSKGVMTGTDAKKQKVGGEILCEIW